MGRSGTHRQIDVFITGIVGAFEVKILVDSKNYAAPVDINDVESLIGMVADVGAHLGALVCPAGYTEGAKRRAETGGIQLYQVYDQSLGNTDLFIPVRYVAARIGKYQFCFSGTSASFMRKIDASGKEHFSLKMDAYSTKEEMIKNGWTLFNSLEEMNNAADIANQPQSVRELLFRETYTIYAIEDPT